MASTAPSVPEGYTLLKEGQATILQHGNDVFYNPAQVINRDLSVAVLRHFVRQRREEIAAGQFRRPRTHQRPPAAASAASAASDPAAASGQPPAAAAAAGPSAKERARREYVPYRPPEDIRILEGLAASGLRSIRYALEIDGVSRVDANDLDEAAAEAIERNLRFNEPRAAAVVRASQGDVRTIALQNPDGYEVVDLDPYGSPTQFLDSAVQAVAEGGLLCVTATDMAVLCGNNGEACWAKYGCYPLHRPYCHEMALRILLACIEAHANRCKRHIVPVLSLSIDFYVRVFVRVHTSPEKVKDSAAKQMYVFQSCGCDSFYTQRVGRKQQKGKGFKFAPGHGPAVPQTCPETGSGFIMGGPFWAGPLHDPAWIQGLLTAIDAGRGRYAAHAKLRALLTAAGEELPDVPLYYSLHAICKTLHTTPPSADAVRSALVNAGYRVSSTHANPLGTKTDAPPEVLWDIMRCWVAAHPSKKPLDPDSYAGKLLAKEPTIKADFSRARGAVSASKAAKTARYLPNPEANWGPKRKAGRYDKSDRVPNGNGAAEAQGAADGEADGNGAVGEASAAEDAAAGASSNGAGPMETAAEDVPVQAHAAARQEAPTEEPVEMDSQAAGQLLDERVEQPVVQRTA